MPSKPERYTVGQLASMAGISVRTLHHFEELGLLAPRRGDNGYRTYGPTDVDRLQQVLLFREMGMPLKDIRDVLDSPDFDHKAALEQHLRELESRREHVDQLIQSVKRTLASLEGGAPMSADQKFEAFKRDLVAKNDAAYGEQARERWGEDAVEAANKKVMGLTPQQYERMQQLEATVRQNLLAAMAADDAAGTHAQDAVAAHADWLRCTWPSGDLTPQMHQAITQSYLADERFLAYYDKWAAGAGKFLVLAVEKYYQNR